MPNKPNEQAQIDFIVDCLRIGEKRNEVLAKFAKKWQSTSTRTFDRRLKEAESILQSEYSHIQSEVDKQVANEISERKKKILTVIERKEILTQIALGEIPLNKPMVVDGSIELIEIVPDWADRKAAIAELNKMDGDYSPTKSNVELNVKQLPSWLKDT